MARSFPNGAIALYDHDLRFLIFDGTRFALPRDAASNVGRTLAEIFPPEVAARIEPVHREALQGRQGRLETVINGRNVEICTSPVRDDSGAVVMGIATSQDVTEERALRTQLALSSRLASLGTLVAGVAHEVNNPLAGTLGSLATAIEDSRALTARVRDGGPIDGEQLVRSVEELVEILLDAQVGGNRIARIVKDLALFGRPNPLRTRVRLGDVVTSSMRWLPASVGRNATVQVDDLGAPDVHASAGQLEQVVVNLVTNAAFAIPEGRRGEVRVRIADLRRRRGGAGGARRRQGDRPGHHGADLRPLLHHPGRGARDGARAPHLPRHRHRARRRAHRRRASRTRARRSASSCPRPTRTTGRSPPALVYSARVMGILQALDEQFPSLHWGASEAEVQTLLPGGRLGPGPNYAVEVCLVGYPYPVVLFFEFDPGLTAISVEYPRSFDLATGDMQLPGRMVAESIYRHLSALAHHRLRWRSPGRRGPRSPPTGATPCSPTTAGPRATRRSGSSSGSSRAWDGSTWR